MIDYYNPSSMCSIITHVLNTSVAAKNLPNEERKKSTSGVCTSFKFLQLTYTSFKTISRGPKSFLKSRNHLQILGARGVAWSKFHTVDLTVTWHFCLEQWNHTCFCKWWNCSNYVEHIRHHRIKFSHPRFVHPHSKKL